jgi:ferritin-like metal-binding protein YciE
MHEDHGYEMNGFCEKLTHLPKDAAAMRQNAVTLLRSAANRFQHLSDAANAFDKHLERAEQRYIRRNAN